MVRPFVFALAASALLVAGPACADRAGKAPAPAKKAQTGGKCAQGTGGLALPPGFCATVFADHLGHVRHMAITADGTVLANSQFDSYAPDKAPTGLIVLRDVDGDGRAERITRPIAGGQGGTGIALYQGFVYLESGSRIVRYPLGANALPEADKGEVVISGLPTNGDHTSHSIVIARDGTLYLNSGSATNACQAENRKEGSPGLNPCDEKALRAGIWRYRADRTGQVFSPAKRHASGICNAVGLALDGQDHLFATQHGRDQLSANWGALYTPEQSQDLPAEELLSVDAGDDFGWPECYFDPGQARLVLAPEYGGDGGHATGTCTTRKGPVAAFPAHWAPNGLAIYEASQFPAAYRGGAFIAFHGSWNRAPGPQGGFNVVFQPLVEGKAAGREVIFADGFAGPGKASGDATYRPTGLAVGPDGALFISDDKQGRIWKVTYHGAPTAAVAAARAVGPVRPAAAATPAAATSAAQPLPAGISPALVALGRRIYAGQVAGAACAGCHGARAQGTAVGPGLVNREWLWSDGSIAGISATIVKGVANPRQFAAPMSAYGGTKLTDGQVRAVAAYVWSVGHGGRP